MPKDYHFRTRLKLSGRRELARRAQEAEFIGYVQETDDHFSIPSSTVTSRHLKSNHITSLVKCCHCSAMVKKTNLDKHTRKVHSKPVTSTLPNISNNNLFNDRIANSIVGRISPTLAMLNDLKSRKYKLEIEIQQLSEQIQALEVGLTKPNRINSKSV